MIDLIQDPAAELRIRTLREAIRHTLAYADVFDFPLSAAEVYRYLHGVRATYEEVRALLAAGIPGVDHHGDFYVLAGRLSTVAERRRRSAFSALPLARVGLYAHILKYLPFVRMVGLTGSLAMHNMDGRDDIDLLVITTSGRVWLGRAAVIALVHLARLGGDLLCPNYVLAEGSLALGDASIYGAHELAQMVPLFGRDVYRRLWASNPQVTAHLPNAQPWPTQDERSAMLARAFKWGVEQLLGGILGDWLEAWERRRKIDQLSQQKMAASPEIVLSDDQCKGHFDQHRTRVLDVFAMRLSQVESGLPSALRPRRTERRHVSR